jgi:hypothetical protein
MKIMLQAYPGRVFNGKPVISDNIKLPEHANLIITIIDDFPIIEKPPTEITQTNIEKKAKAINALRGIVPPDFEFNLEDIRLERVKKRGLWND